MQDNTSDTVRRGAADPSIGAALMARLDAFAAFSEEPGALTRLFLTPEHAAAAKQLSGWMAEAGMTVRTDALGTVIGRYEGTAPGMPALLLGSHIDTVRNAGKYDGNLGVLAALAAVQELNRRGERLPFAVEVLGFGDEEGVRFPVTLTSSRAVGGTLTPAMMEVADREGVTLSDALRAFGGDPGGIAGAARRDALGYVELHIEQGPVLEAENLPVGIVTAINGATRLTATVTGMAGHAGTVPMALRRDALAAAAEMVLAVEATALETPDLVATVGRIAAEPGAVNVIPSRAVFTIDARSSSDATRRAGLDAITGRLRAVAARRGLDLSLETGHEATATACAPGLIRQLESAVERCGFRPLRLASGAGHDAMAVAAAMPVGMLFVRCRGGISHHPAESITAEDAGTAVAVLLDFLRHFDPSNLAA
ncbi:allantoate amidohydrolase [Azospirillum sp. SYSU D00513]|uniref:allantoate amidohydrolase n=2 Tax=Pseudomonadati TaxID=3379134 RepID=UPI0032B4AEDB